MTDQPKKQDGGGRPPILDENKRRKIIALLANGSSRRVAGRIAGCSHTTIERTAQRDPEFAAELEAAEHNVEIEALQQIRKAAKKDRYWRAAAWLLERTNPRDFTRRTPDTLTEEDAYNLGIQIATPFVHQMTDEEFDDFKDRLYNTLRALHESNELTKYLPIPEPEPPIYLTRENDPPKSNDKSAEKWKDEADVWNDDDDDETTVREPQGFFRQSPQSPCHQPPEGFAPHTPAANVEPQTPPLPELLIPEQLPTSQLTN